MSYNVVGNSLYKLPNVASVPQLSPFRYPGGKSRWYNLIRAWMEYARPKRFVEPFAGGAHAGLAVAVKGLADEVVLVEKDRNVSAVWQTIIDGDVRWLINEIKSLNLTRSRAREIIERGHKSIRDRALATIVQNRVSRGGITAPGSGWLRDGENDDGMQSRWYPSTLANRIERIAEVRERIHFISGDAFEVIPRYQDEDSAVFIDPPYPETGERLYEHADVNHEKVFKLAEESDGTVLLTYGASKKVAELVDRHGFEFVRLIASTTHHQEKTEILIGDDLVWMQNLPK